jgi:AraC-like DNA-binding protein
MSAFQVSSYDNGAHRDKTSVEQPGGAMTGTPDDMIENPDRVTDRNKTDLLSDVLSRVRLSGAIFLRGEYAAPWAFDSPESRDLVALLAPGAPRLVLFHVVKQGLAWVSARGERIELEPGDLAVLPHADRHLMGSMEHAEPIPIASLLPPPPWQGVPVCRFDGGGQTTEVVCGYLKCDDLLFNSLLRHLPPLFRVRPPAGPTRDLIQACIGYALDESRHTRDSGITLTARMPELLLIEALRLYSEQSVVDTGWLAAINDAIVGRALALMHAEPGRKWTVEELARRAATSRSVLDERFRRLLGQSPMRYAAEWRMQLAAEQLRNTPAKLADIAQVVGYGSEEAFSRAFQRHVGVAPAQWRSGAQANK